MKEIKVFHSSFWQIAGPLTLLAAYALAAALPLSSFPFDLFIVGAIGLYFCSRWHVKGCAYGLMVLSLAGICGHLFLETHHFLRLGLEASLACSFIAAALSFENEAEGSAGLQSRLALQASAIQNLEDEIGRVREFQVEIQLSSAKKIDELQKNCEEISADKSSLEVLNDVLRKANAAYFEEKTAIENSNSKNLKNWEFDNEAPQNFCSEQGTIAERQSASENENFEEKPTLSKPNSSSCLDITLEDKRLLESARSELELLQNELARLQDLQMDRSDLLERLALAELKVRDLAKVEALYKQLKGQFEEKNRVLHEARASLFKAETALQTLSLEKEEINSLLPESLRVELDRLDQEMTELREENLQLHGLATHLTQSLSQPISFAVHRTPLPAGQPSLEDTLRESLIPKRKKKVKKPAQQDLLF